MVVLICFDRENDDEPMHFKQCYIGRCGLNGFFGLGEKSLESLPEVGALPIGTEVNFAILLSKDCRSAIRAIAL